MATVARKIEGNPFEPGSMEEPLRRQLAKSMCRRYDLAGIGAEDRLTCEVGMCCEKRSVCTEMADGVLAYARLLREEREEKRAV